MCLVSSHVSASMSSEMLDVIVVSRRNQRNTSGVVKHRMDGERTTTQRAAEGGGKRAEWKGRGMYEVCEGAD